MQGGTSMRMSGSLLSNSMRWISKLTAWKHKSCSKHFNLCPMISFQNIHFSSKSSKFCKHSIASHVVCAALALGRPWQQEQTWKGGKNHGSMNAELAWSELHQLDPKLMRKHFESPKMWKDGQCWGCLKHIWPNMAKYAKIWTGTTQQCLKAFWVLIYLFSEQTRLAY